MGNNKAMILIIAASALLLLSSAEADECNTTIPLECQGVLKFTVDGAALLDPDFADNYCGDTCGELLYTYLRDCDGNVTNATKFDVYCAKDGEKTCNSFFGSVLFEGLLPCSSALESAKCTTACRESLMGLADRAGCCLTSILDVVLEGFGDLLFLLCEIDEDKCDGRFTEMPAPPDRETDDCDSLREGLSSKCRTYSYIEVLYILAENNPTRITADFCEGDCAKPVYDFYVECDKKMDRRAAATTDFLCTKSDEGRECADLLQDPEIEDIDPNCEGQTDDSCPANCTKVLDNLSERWGCCLLTYGVLINNLTYIEGVTQACNLENTDLCVGGISGDNLTPTPTPTPTAESGTGMLVGSILLLGLAQALTKLI